MITGREGKGRQKVGFLAHPRQEELFQRGESWPPAVQRLRGLQRNQ